MALYIQFDDLQNIGCILDICSVYMMNLFINCTVVTIMYSSIKKKTIINYNTFFSRL